MLNVSKTNNMYLTSFSSIFIFIHSRTIFKWSIISLVIYESLFNTIILCVFTFDFKEVFMHIFVERHLLDSSDALATNKQNFSRNVGTERRQETSRT